MPDLGVKTLKELVDYAKARPGQLNWGSPGVGTGGHLVTELLLKRTGIKASTCPIPARRSNCWRPPRAPCSSPSTRPAIRAACATPARSSPLAVTGAQRSVSAPDVPTFKELGYEGFDDLYVANGLLAPIGTPKAMIEALNREMVRMNTSGTIRDRLVEASYEPGTISPEEYGAMIDRELAQWGAIVRETGVQMKT